MSITFGSDLPAVCQTSAIAYVVHCIVRDGTVDGQTLFGLLDKWSRSGVDISSCDGLVARAVDACAASSVDVGGFSGGSCCCSRRCDVGSGRCVGGASRVLSGGCFDRTIGRSVVDGDGVDGRSAARRLLGGDGLVGGGSYSGQGSDNGKPRGRKGNRGSGVVGPGYSVVNVEVPVLSAGIESVKFGSFSGEPASHTVVGSVVDEASKRSSPVRGSHWERNKRKRDARRGRRVSRSDGDWNNKKYVSHDSDLAVTSVEKWKAQNRLAAEKARRELAVLEANDVEGEIKRYRAGVVAATERKLVSIEKTHAKLAAAGDVPGVVGSVETVVSGATPGLSSGSISPNSSASMAEYWAVDKRAKDAEAKLKRMHEITGLDPEHIDLIDKKVWTDTSANNAILDGLYPDGFASTTEFQEDGKFRLVG